MVLGVLHACNKTNQQHLIVFEDRSLSWLSSLPKKKIFNSAIIFTYRPEKKSRLKELKPLVQARSNTYG